MNHKFVILVFLITIGLSGTPLTSAHVGTVTSLGTTNPPTLDGAIDELEWADAKLYENVGGDGKLDIYLKHDNYYFYIGIRVDDELKHDRDSIMIDFDEGDDGVFGSGSYDGVLKDNQEDCKKVVGEGLKLDGFWSITNDPLFDNLAGFYWSPIDIDFNAGFAFHDEYWEFEFRIPYQGTEGRTWDRSDLIIETTEIVGVCFRFINFVEEIAPHEFRYEVFSYPRGVEGDQPTTWLGLQFDSDMDGLSDNEETVLGTSLWNSDTDGDNLSDAEEVKTHQTNPLDVDTDNDGIQDNEEIKTYSTNPLELDTDDDGLDDKEEIMLGANPLISDTDGDGLRDGEEVNRGTDLFNTDTDGDFFGDSIDPWPTSAILPNALIILAVIICVIGVVWWRKRG